MKNEIEKSLSTLASLESENEELRRLIIEAENNSPQSFSENELLVGTNIQLKTRIDKIQESLNSVLLEK